MRSIVSLCAPVFILAAIIVMPVHKSVAAELLMVEEKWCHWCEKWNEEIGGIYDKTDEGRRAPLRRVDIHAGLPTDVELTSRPQYTPTFILIHEGKEVSRIEGYPGEDFFWGLLGRMLDKLPATTTRANLEASAND